MQITFVRVKATYSKIDILLVNGQNVCNNAKIDASTASESIHSNNSKSAFYLDDVEVWSVLGMNTIKNKQSNAYYSNAFIN